MIQLEIITKLPDQKQNHSNWIRNNVQQRNQPNFIKSFTADTWAYDKEPQNLLLHLTAVGTVIFSSIQLVSEVFSDSDKFREIEYMLFCVVKLSQYITAAFRNAIEKRCIRENRTA